MDKNEKIEPVFDFPEKKEKSTAPIVKDEKIGLKEVTPTSEIGKQVLVTETDSYILERMKLQPKTLEGISVMETELPPGRHRLSLPKELEQFTKDLAFHWIFRDKRAIDEAIDKGWVFVNRQLFPKLPGYLFTIAGAIEKGDLILACMSKKKAEARTKQAQDKSADMVKAQVNKHKEDDEVYYKPKLSVAEEENATAPGLQEGRDFAKPKESEE